MKENDAALLACEYLTSTSYFAFEHSPDASVDNVELSDILLHSFDSTTPPPTSFRHQNLLEKASITQADVLKTPALGNYSTRAPEGSPPHDDTIVRPLSNPCPPALSPTTSQPENVHSLLEQAVVIEKEPYCHTMSLQHGTLQTNNSSGFEIDGALNSRCTDHIAPLDHYHHQLLLTHHSHVGDSIDAEEISQDRSCSDIPRNNGVMGHPTRPDHQNVIPIQTLQPQSDTVVRGVLQSPPNTPGLRSSVKGLHRSGSEAMLCSPGHQPYPDVDPGHILGVRRPLHTQQHVLFDVPFYGIENVEISSDRYALMTRSYASHGHEAQLSNHDTAGHLYNDSVSLVNHREYIWSIAHEDEYGLPVNTEQEGVSGVSSNNGNSALVWGRYKRLHRCMPIRPTTNPNSVSGSQEGVTRGGPISDSSTDTTLSSRPEPRVSQGVYGPDSFMESLEASREPPVPLKGRRRWTALILRQQKNCLTVLFLMVITGVVVAVLLLKRSSSTAQQPQDDDIDITEMESNQ